MQDFQLLISEGAGELGKREDNRLNMCLQQKILSEIHTKAKGKADPKTC